MEYPVSVIVSDVKVAIDENMGSQHLIEIGDPNALSLDDIIESKILDGVCFVEMNAPVRMLEGGKDIPANIAWEGDTGNGSGIIGLPEDFMRLIVFQMSDWNLPVSEAISIDNPMYQMQKSRFAGIRGNPEKPVCAIVPSSSGMSLEFFSSYGGAGVTVKAARYLPLPKAKDSSVSIPVQCYRPSVYYTAALVLETFGKKDLSDMLKNTSMQLLN